MARKLDTEMVSEHFHRLGQFYYFATSDFVTDLVGDQEGAMPFILKIIPFRHKHSVHRSLDCPRGETPEIQDNQSMMLQGAGIIGMPRGGKSDKTDIDEKDWYPELIWESHYPGYQINAGDGDFREFFPERDHDKIHTEAYTIFEKVMATA